jgi:hypothetical protein
MMVVFSTINKSAQMVLALPGQWGASPSASKTKGNDASSERTS